jgi:hypothetical protein
MLLVGGFQKFAGIPFGISRIFQGLMPQQLGASHRKNRSIQVLLALSLAVANFVFAERATTFPDLNRPHQIAVDNDQLYIIDDATIHIYSLKNFALKKAFGKRGEGPQEFKEWSQKDGIVFDAQTDNIVVTSQGKISIFRKDGNCEKEIKVPSARIVKPLGKNFVGYARFYNQDNVLFNKLYLYSPEMKQLKIVFEKESHIQLRQGKGWIIFAAPFKYCVYDDKLYVAAENDFVIHVFDCNGKSLPPIKMEYKRLKLTDDLKNGVREYLKTDPLYRDVYEKAKKNCHLPEYFPAIRSFNIADGKIYVRTYSKTGNKTEFFIFAAKGRWLMKVFLPIAEYNLEDSFPFTIKNGKLYQLIENPETENYELYVTKIE